MLSAVVAVYIAGWLVYGLLVGSKLMAPYIVIVADNVLWSGRVLDESDQSDDTRAIRAFNDMVVNDPRVTCVMATVRDGVLLIRRA